MTSRTRRPVTCVLAFMLAFAVAFQSGALPSRRALLSRIPGATREAYAAPPPAVEPATPREAAREAFERGVALYERGQIAEALASFERAYVLAPSYKLLGYIGELSFELGDFPRAEATLTAYLAEGGERVTEPKRRACEAKLAEARRHVGAVVLSLAAGARDAVDVRVDGRAAGTRVTPGEHARVVTLVGTRTLHIAREGRAESRRDVDVRPGAETLVTLDDERAASADSIDGETPSARPSPALSSPALSSPASGATSVSSRSPVPTAAVAGLSVAGALGLSAAVTGVLAVTASSTFTRPGFASGTPNAAYEAQRAKVRHLALATDVLAGAALVTGATALYFALRGRSSPASSTAAVSSACSACSTFGAGIELDVGPTSASLRAAF